MEILRFYKEKSKKWYADIPSWTGRKSSLRMMGGADVLLNVVADGRTEVYLHFSKTSFAGADVLTFKRFTWINGATYRSEKYLGKDTNFKVWLCDVTLHVLGEFPDKIYFVEVEYNE